MKEYKILLVDDEPEVVRNTINLLDQNNKGKYIFYQAIRASMAYRIACSKMPDLIITDWVMPEMNGIELIKKIKNNPETSHIPIMMATGTMMTIEDLDIALSAGASDYIRKPIEKIELNARVKAMLQLSDTIQTVKQQNIELKKAKKNADNANRLKSQFLANMSHEIRTPMNAIIGFSNILQKRIENPEQKKIIDKIIKSGKTLLELINDILDLSKIEAGQLEIQKEPTDIFTLFGDIPLIFSEISKQKKIPINTTIDASIPKILLLDELRIRQILINLVSNAIKFTEKGNVKVIVKYQKLPNPNKLSLQIEVSDTGIGIPENQIEQIFESFRQVEGQSTRKHGGTGLGLSITKKLVELMDGTITVKSKQEIGSNFKININNVEILNEEKFETINNQDVNIIFNNPEILHVEDIYFNREIISLYLEDKGVILKEVETGQEALEILENYTPNLILMDIQMPGINGYETTKIIRQNQRLKTIPIIALTANATKSEIKKYSSVFDEYITKPIDEKTLINTLAKYLKHEKEQIIITEITENACIADLLKQKEQEIYFSDELKNAFRTEIEPLHKEISEILSIDALNVFANKNKTIGEKYKINAIVKYSKELKMSINVFDLEKIENLIKLYNQIIKIIIN